MSGSHHNAKRPIHIGILLSYDYKYLPLCLSRIYGEADRIMLAIDRNRKSWAGNVYEFDESIIKYILDKDYDGKIAIYEDDFSVPGMGTLECDMRERRMVYEAMGSEREGAWHLQIDTDEYFVDFSGFVSFLRQLEVKYKGTVTVMPKFVTMFKVIDGGVVLAEDGYHAGYFPVACSGTHRGSLSGDGIEVCCEYEVLHQSWGRSEEEIAYKVANWGHSRDFDTESYYKFWKSVDRYNSRYIRDCHPFGVSNGWNRLLYVEGSTEDIIEKLYESRKSQRFGLHLIFMAKMKKMILKTTVGQKLKKIVKRERS